MTARMTEALDQDVIRRVFSKRLGRASATEMDRLEHGFLAQVFDDFSPDELPEITSEILADALADFWHAAAVRGDDQPIVLTHGALTRADGAATGLEQFTILQDDKPFLVDSVIAELSFQGVAVRALYHPVLRLGRAGGGQRWAQGDDRAESMIFVIVDTLGPERAEAVRQGLLKTLGDVRAAVEDFPQMLARLDAEIAHLPQTARGVLPEVLEESVAFLKWLRGDEFVFLGARAYAYPRLPDGDYAPEAPLVTEEFNLGVLRDPVVPVLRDASEPAVLTPQLVRQAFSSRPVSVAKANLQTRVHRRAHMDYVSIRRYGPEGDVIGEVRFVGLFTAEAYDLTTAEVPLIRQKAQNVMDRAAALPGGHTAKRLRNVLENYPRDELFQVDEDDLLRIALGVVHLYDRPRVRLFARSDPFDRFVSALFFVPRESYSDALRIRAAEMIAGAWGGRISSWYPQLSDAPLVRVHFIVGVKPGDHPIADLEALEADLAEAARTYSGRLEEALRTRADRGADAIPDAHAWLKAFPKAYQDRYDVGEAVRDLEAITLHGAGAGLKARAYLAAGDAPSRFRFKLTVRGVEAAPLSHVLPILEHFGFRVLEEYGFHLTPAPRAGSWWVHEFFLEDPLGEGVAFEAFRSAFEAAFEAVWTGLNENDGFNRLVIDLGVSWRQAAVLRALCRYRQQSGLDPSQAVQEEALRENLEPAKLLLQLFDTRFNPAGAGAHSPAAAGVAVQLTNALQNVASLNHDRVLRRLAQLVGAIMRTNYYQTGPDGAPKPYISFKIASRAIIDLPSPKPFAEIFVWSPDVEAVHLRFGPVARGGIRWSDRRDDFRTEVLGLVKAQQVKNAVIVPVGSKGGFFPKKLPRGGTAEQIRAEGVRAYKIFLSGLLDITDNLDPNGAVVRPKDVVIWDKDDPYLVLAADKGTATFSDIANGVAADYGFWLGDAFASGGSVGYDHKAMGITARGAWEAVKRHFREIGKNIQVTPFTCVGVGDMSGDVFGNGMLLSTQTKLVAAFDHRDIFLDPDPDIAASFAERQRLFALPRSSWADYDAGKISAGGGVYSRSLKSIPLSPEIRQLLDINEDSLTPSELIQAILTAPVELLYLGGIGTYVKAAAQSHLDVGDKANDAVRVDAESLRVKVVGEGANLGVTQAGRIAFARHGGRINTDAIDNSAGVDTSDHEVNIKILTTALESGGKLDRPGRDALLASMTQDIADSVLRHNYDQTLALSLVEADAVKDLDAHAQLMTRWERSGRLDRKLEGLPGQLVLAELKGQGRGLARPEIAVLVAYGKIELFDTIVESTAPDDPYFLQTLERYFPAALHSYDQEMRRHRLRREIVATVLANEIVNKTGPAFAERLMTSAECDIVGLVRAYAASLAIFRLDEAWAAVNKLDGRVSHATQLALYGEIQRVLRRTTFWLARRAGTRTRTVQDLIDDYLPVADALKAEGAGLLSKFEQDDTVRRVKALIGAQAPAEVAAVVASLRPLVPTSDIADLAAASQWTPPAMARLYHQVGATFSFDRLLSAAGSLASNDPWERLAVRRLIEELLDEQYALTHAVAKASREGAGASAQTAARAILSWIGDRRQHADQARRTLEDIESSGSGWSFAKLTIANAALRELASQADSKPAMRA